MIIRGEMCNAIHNLHKYFCGPEIRNQITNQMYLLIAIRESVFVLEGILVDFVELFRSNDNPHSTTF